MKKIQKVIIFLLIVAFFGQAGYAIRVIQPNLVLGDQQEVFRHLDSAESRDLGEILGIAYYPLEDSVSLRCVGGDLFSEVSNIPISRQGTLFEEKPTFYQSAYVYDFEVDDGKGYLLVEGQGPYLVDAAGNGVVIMENSPNRREFEVSGNQIARIGLPSNFSELHFIGDSEEYQFATLPEDFNDQQVIFDRVLPLGFVDPAFFDFSADGEKIVAVGRENKNDLIHSFEALPASESEAIYIELLTVPTEANVEVQPFERLNELEPLEPITPGFHFEVKLDEYGDNEQALSIRDLYATEDYIVILINEMMQYRSFIQRYTYKGKLVDQLETNAETWNITEGPDGSTLYAQNWYMEESEERVEFRGLDSEPFGPQLEIIQMNWDGNKVISGLEGRMKPVIAERTFKGRTIARFADKGFGLIKQMEAETGIVDYRAPLRSSAADVRLQIPYADLMAKSGMGARALVLTYQGQNIAIPFDLLLSADVNEMPCQDDATIEIHLQVDEEGNISYTIELYVVEQVNAMTRVVHRKAI